MREKKQFADRRVKKRLFPISTFISVFFAFAVFTTIQMKILGESIDAANIPNQMKLLFLWFGFYQRQLLRCGQISKLQGIIKNQLRNFRRLPVRWHRVISQFILLRTTQPINPHIWMYCLRILIKWWKNWEV